MGGPGHSDHSEGSEQSEGLEKAGSDGSEGSEASEKTTETCFNPEFYFEDNRMNCMGQIGNISSPFNAFDM